MNASAGNRMSSEYVICAVNAAEFMERAYGFKPDPWQEEILLCDDSRIALLCSRQSGKSTVCATRALHKAVFFRNSLVLIISKSARQAEETFRKVKEGLPYVSSMCRVEHETQSMLELVNGSRIISLPGKQESVRSYSAVALMIIDEAAQVCDDLYNSVKPMLAVSQGTLMALSTPYGKQGWFFEAWDQHEDWKKIMITADDCPRITEEFLERERKEIGAWWFDQEYYCKFTDEQSQLFSHEHILAAITPDLRVLRLV